MTGYGDAQFSSKAGRPASPVKTATGQSRYATRGENEFRAGPGRKATLETSRNSALMTPGQYHGYKKTKNPERTGCQGENR
jgi:hypothetical protein